MTLDGINIQDNYLRDNGLDYNPNRLLTGQMTLVTPNGNSAASGGSCWYNRNSRFAANDWFNNRSGVAQPRRNRNQAGASMDEPIVKDKLFFYVNYEAVRTNRQQPSTATVQTDDARNGIFTCTLRGVATRVNLPKQEPAASAINTFSVGDSTPAILKNTAGYRFNQSGDEVRDNVTARCDYNFSAKHVFRTSYIWNRDNTDRPGLETDFSVIPRITNPNHSHSLSANWRWTPAATLTNELRGGFNLVTGRLFTNPVTETPPQGRATNTYALCDNAALQYGQHFIQFGFHMQRIRVHAYNDAGILPAYSLAMGTGRQAFVRSEFAGIGGCDLATANALPATLGGYIDGYRQTFNVTSRTSGYQAGAGTVRNLKLSEYDLYVQDNRKLLPVLQNGDARQTLLSNATPGFAGASAGRPWHKRELTAFAPNIGLAWGVFGTGRTSVRAGYLISYLNDQASSAPRSIAEANSGLVGLSPATGLSGRVGTGLPSVAPPVYKVPLTVADNYAGNPFNTVGLISPDLKTPDVRQYSAGIQHEVFHTVFEARYVGNHVVKACRAFDHNQVVIQDNGFLADFRTAQNIGNLAPAKNGPFGKGRLAVPLRALKKAVEDWSLGGIAGWQPGAPFSILPGYGTLNRANGCRSYCNTTNTSLTMPQLAGVVRYEMTGNGPYIVAQPAINPNDGSGTNAVVEAAFQGQIFSNPGANTLGTLQRRTFSGPGSFDVDLSVQRHFRITEGQSVEVRMEGVNIPNHPLFYWGGRNLNSATFGVRVSTFHSAREMQFAARDRC
jgi:hypothetical protein